MGVLGWRAGVPEAVLFWTFFFLFFAHHYAIKAGWKKALCAGFEGGGGSAGDLRRIASKALQGAHRRHQGRAFRITTASSSATLLYSMRIVLFTTASDGGLVIEDTVACVEYGIAMVVPVSMVQGLATAKPAEIRKVELAGQGHGLYWPSLDLDMSVPDLIAGCLGTKAWMTALARHAGRATSAAKSASSRANGKKGGRPRKVAVPATRALTAS